MYNIARPKKREDVYNIVVIVEEKYWIFGWKVRENIFKIWWLNDVELLEVLKVL